MKTLRQTFDEFANHFPIPKEERKKLFTLYVDTYSFAMGKTKEVTSGQTQTKSEK